MASQMWVNRLAYNQPNKHIVYNIYIQLPVFSLKNALSGKYNYPNLRPSALFLFYLPTDKWNLKYAHYVGTNFFTALAIIFFNIPANVVHSGSSVLSSCL